MTVVLLWSLPSRNGEHDNFGGVLQITRVHPERQDGAIWEIVQPPWGCGFMVTDWIGHQP